MLGQIFCTAALVLSVLAAPRPLQDCSFHSAEPCKCPSGTTFQSSTTYAVIGAAAKDVKDITFDFFNTEWFGATPVTTTGRDNTLGATRSLSDGTSTFVEELVSSKEKPNGSFIAKYQQQNAPLKYNTSAGSGSYSGYWDTLDVGFAGPDKTAITWHIYACFTSPGPFATFHESAINNVTSILQSEGKICGKNVLPHSE